MTFVEFLVTLPLEYSSTACVFRIDQFDLSKAVLLRSFKFGIDCIAQSANWIKLNTEYVNTSNSIGALRVSYTLREASTPLPNFMYQN